MPQEDLRRQLGISQLTAKSQDQMSAAKARAIYSREEYERTRDRLNSVWKKGQSTKPPKSFFAVVISPKSPISTPEKLQEIAELEAIPQVFETIFTTLFGDLDERHVDEHGQPEKVNVAEISPQQLRTLRSKTEYDFSSYIQKDGQTRGVTIVTSLTKTKEHSE